MGLRRHNGSRALFTDHARSLSSRGGAEEGEGGAPLPADGFCRGGVEGAPGGRQEAQRRRCLGLVRTEASSDRRSSAATL